MAESARIQPLLILGTGTFAAEVADLVSDIKGFEVAGFVESLERDRCAGGLDGLPVLWVDDLVCLRNTHVAVCAIGTPRRRSFIEQVAAMGIRFATLVHPSARVSRTSVVGEGSVVSANVVVAAHTRVGSHVILNRGALVGHHAAIGDYATISPGANIGGSSTIGEGTFVGMGAIIVDHIRVGEECFVCAGALVARAMPAGFRADVSRARLLPPREALVSR